MSQKPKENNVMVWSLTKTTTEEKLKKKGEVRCLWVLSSSVHINTYTLIYAYSMVSNKAKHSRTTPCQLVQIKLG